MRKLQGAGWRSCRRCRARESLELGICARVLNPGGYTRLVTKALPARLGRRRLRPQPSSLAPRAISFSESPPAALGRCLTGGGSRSQAPAGIACSLSNFRAPNDGRRECAPKILIPLYPATSRKRVLLRPRATRWAPSGGHDQGARPSVTRIATSTRGLMLGRLIRGLLNSDLSIRTVVIKMIDLSDSVEFRQYRLDTYSSHDREAVREAFREVPALSAWIPLRCSSGGILPCISL